MTAIDDVTVSGDNPFASLDDDVRVSPNDDSFGAVNDEIVDGEFTEDEPDSRQSRLRGEREESPNREASNKIPDIDQWMNFFSNVVIRVLSDYYIQAAFSGVDDDLLSDREIDLVTLSIDERKRVARPFAEFSNKNKFMRKHGREIIATGDSLDALLQLGLWFTRVNRIARKYRSLQETGQVPIRRNRRKRYGESNDVGYIPKFPQQPTQHETAHSPDPMNGAFDVSVDASQATPSRTGSIARNGRPSVNGVVYSPGGG